MKFFREDYARTHQFENVSKFNFTIDVEGVNDNPPEIFGASKLITLIKGIQNRFKLNLTDADGDDVGVTIVSGSQFGRFVKGKENGKEVNAFNNTDDDIYFLTNQNAELDSPDGITISFSDGLHPTKYDALRIILRELELTVNSNEIELPQGTFIRNLNQETINITTNGYEEDIICEVTSAPSSGNLMKESGKVTKFGIEDLKNEAIVLLIEKPKMTRDQFEVTCGYPKPDQGSADHDEPYTLMTSVVVDISIVCGLKLTSPKLILNPDGPTKFGRETVDFSSLTSFYPIKFHHSRTNQISFIKMVQKNRLRREDTDTHPLVIIPEIQPDMASEEPEVNEDQPEVTDDEPEVELVDWNGYKFEKISEFTSADLDKVFIDSSNLEARNDVTITVEVSGDSIPTAPFIFSATTGSANNQTTLPNYGLSHEEIHGDSDASSDASENTNSTAPLGGIRDGRVIEPDESRGSGNPGDENDDTGTDPNGLDSGKATKSGNGDGDGVNGDVGDDEDDFDIGKLLYIIPIAIICVLLIIFIIVIIFTRYVSQKLLKNDLGMTQVTLNLGDRVRRKKNWVIQGVVVLIAIL